MKASRVSIRTLDLDLIAETDAWLVIDPVRDEVLSRARRMLLAGTGTVVIWEKLDRVLPENRSDGGFARRRLASVASRTIEHLGIVFHRYLEGIEGNDLVITVNGNKVEPWNPFAADEQGCVELPHQKFEITVGNTNGKVLLRRFVLPSRDQFSSPEEFDRLSGPRNWNRQQGIYIYRAKRLVQWGGWNGLRGIDEHTKLARASLDFDTDLDATFNINVAKMRVTVPPQLRQMLVRPINELCSRADDAYRKTSRRVDKPGHEDQPAWSGVEPTVIGPAVSEAGLALRAAAMRVGEYKAFQRIVDAVRLAAPEVTSALGLDD
jgi:hypothetical protein